MRYLVYGYYGHGNFGDDLLLEGVVEGTRRRDANASFEIHSRDPVRAYAADPDIRFTGLARRLEGVRARPWRMLGYLVAFARAIGKSDVLVIGGGTLFIDKGRVNLSLVLLLLAVWYARARRRKVVIIGVAVDELTNSVTRWVTGRIFGAAQFIAVRDDVSLVYASHVPNHRVTRSADLVFGFDVAPLPTPVPRPRPVIGLCVIDYFGTVEVSPERREALTATVSALIERYNDRYDFALIVLQRGIGQKDDWLEPELRRKWPSLRVHDMGDLSAAARMFAEVDAVITTRYHLGVLALLWGKRVIVIDHELKMRSLAEDFGLPMLSLVDFAAEGIPHLDSLLGGADPERIAEALARERHRVAGNFAWMA
jgi:polysaccharide pyruvyl transferase WcaK-like protein